MWEGSTVATVAVGLFVVVFLLERLALVRGWRLYYRLGLPLFPRPQPLVALPEGRGETATVWWAISSDPPTAWFHAAHGGGEAPWGLHGLVDLVADHQGRVQLMPRWSPPWTPIVAMMWFAGLGLSRGEGLLTVPLATLLVAAMLALYRQAALRAVAELRWAWVQER